MPIKPFSVQRFILYISCIAFSALVLYINSIFNPIYDSNTFIVLVCFYFFFSAAYSFTDLIGINKKVNTLEENIRKNEFREMIKSDVHRMAQDIRPRVEETIEKKEPTELDIYDKAYTDAETSWKKKKREERNSFEQYHSTLYQLRKSNKYITLITIFLNMALGIVLLNTLTPIIYAIVIFVFLLPYVPILLRIKKLRKRERALYQEITPTKLKEFLEMVQNGRF